MEGLYMIAIMPPPELALIIDMERKSFAQKYNSIKALKPPVHITLYPPFKENTDIENDLADLINWSSQQMPFQIDLSHFNFFDNSFHPVVYIDVVENQRLQELYTSLLQDVNRLRSIRRETNKFKPHLTIGYRDIPPEIFPAIKEEYAQRKFIGSFICHSVFLWKYDGKTWQIQHEFMFGGSGYKSRHH